ncbi:MAG: nucleotidyltransferase domain-containing protein [archaeon]
MLQKYSIWKVAGIFFQEPTKEHGLLEICRKTKIAHTSVKNHLKNLKTIKIISEHTEKKGSRLYPIYKAEQNNKTFRDYKKIYNLSELITSGLINHLNDTLTPKAITLFGSYQRGEDIEDSDIDIFIETKKTEINTEKFEKLLKRKIQLHFKENFKKYPKDLKNNILNGTILEGYLEAF